MTIRVGSLVYATDQGLGILAKAFYDHHVVSNVVVIRHSSYPNHDEEWYPAAPMLSCLRSKLNIRFLEDFCAACDVMLFFETPFRWDLINHCRAIGTKTALMTMYECTPEILPAIPDLFLCPSALDYRCFPDRRYHCQVPVVLPNGSHEFYTRSLFLPVPVDPKTIPWRQRDRAHVFVHNAGHCGLRGRNGTAELLEAWKYVQSPAKLLLRSQERIEFTRYERESAHGVAIHVTNGTLPYSQLWEEGDVFIFPEKFNGLSLPLQEARAAGMLVMTTARFPNTEWLPLEPLINVEDYRKSRIGPPYREFDEAVITPQEIAATIDRWYDRDITEYSESGRVWAESHSWERLGPDYHQLLTKLVENV